MLLFFPSPFPTATNAFGFFALSSCSFSLSLSPPTVALSVSSDTALAFSLSLSSPTVALSLSLSRFHLRLLFFRFIAFKCIRLFVSFTSDCCSFTSSLTLSSPTVVLSRYRFQMHSSLCRFHLRLLLFHFLFVPSDCTAASEQEFVGMHSASWLPLLFFVLADLSGLF
jgi:hypothetical protein